MQGLCWPLSIWGNCWPRGLLQSEPGGCSWQLGHQVQSSAHCSQNWQCLCDEQEALGGDLEQIQSIERNNNCFYTNYNYCNKLYLPSHTVRCECSNSCWLCCHPSCWQQSHCPCDPRLCCRTLRLCDACCIDGHESNSSCLGKACWWAARV